MKLFIVYYKLSYNSIWELSCYIEAENVDKAYDEWKKIADNKFTDMGLKPIFVRFLECNKL